MADDTKAYWQEHEQVYERCVKAWPVAAWVGTRSAEDRVVACPEDARPLNEWIGRHVGA